MVHAIRLAGFENGYRKLKSEIVEETKAIRRLVMEFGEHFLRDAYFGLDEMVADGRMLIIESVEQGRPVIDGCIGYELLPLRCIDPATGKKMVQRLVMLRLLAVRESPMRGVFARLLALEAQLRGTIRARYDNPDWPHALGTLGVISEHNGRGLNWAGKHRGEAKIISPDSSLVDDDPALLALRLHAEKIHRQFELEHSIFFVVSNRTNLVEAAVLNRAGRDVLMVDGWGSFQVRYDPTDLYQPWLETAVANLAEGNPVTLERLGLRGDRASTPWGPPAVEGMRILLTGDDDPTEDISR